MYLYYDVVLIIILVCFLSKKKKPPLQKEKKKKKFNEGLNNYFARYNNFILLNSYLFLNIFEYEVNLFLFVSFFFHLSLNMMWIILIFF